MFSFLYGIRPSHFFVFAALLLGGFYFCVRPPLQSPDEFNHFARAYQISEGSFFPEKKDQRLGGEIPVCFEEFLWLYKPATYITQYKMGTKELLEGFEIPFSDKKRVFRDFPNTSLYSPVSYLPQAIVLFVLRQFNCSVGFMYHVSRLFVFLLWILCMFFVIRLLPGFKWLFVALILLPMHIYLAVSYSADTVTNILSFLFIALMLRYAFRPQNISTRGLVILGVLCLFLALSKTIYVGLLFLLLLIPQSSFRSKVHKYTALGVIVFCSFLAAFLWSQTIMTYFIAYENYNLDYRIHTTIHEGMDYAKQKEYIASHGSHIFEVLYNTATKTAKFYLPSYIGQFGTFMDTKVADWFFKCSFLVLIGISLLEKNTFRISLLQRLILFTTAIITFSLVILSQHLIWNNVGRDIADSIQGRYLIPVIPLVLMAVTIEFSKLRLNMSPLVMLFVLSGNAYVCDLLYKRYFKEIYVSKTEFKSDLEETGAAGFLKTSDPSVSLKDALNRTAFMSRSGKYALKLPPGAKVGRYKIEDLHTGDLIQITAWQKGTSGELVIEGRGSKCGGFYFPNRDLQVTDEKGWIRMQMTFLFELDCDSIDAGIYLGNISTQDTVYFDDLRYSIKRFKH